jgi:uncharacterized membrane protein
VNTSAVRWLLDLETIPDDAERLRIAWEHPWPGWSWVLLVLGCAALALWSYRRLSGRRGARAALAAVRFGIVLLALILLSGPMLELPRETVEQDWVLILADRSASMTITDAGRGSRSLSRDEQLRRLIDDHAVTWGALAEQRQVRWLGFHAGVFDLARDDADPEAVFPAEAVELGEPGGDRTSLSAALDQALQRAAARPVSGVLILSDGRTTDPPNRSIMRRLQAEAIPVYTVGLGSPEPRGDLALRRVEAPRRAFIRDKVPVVVEIDRFGAAVRELGGAVRLVDELSGETLDSAGIAPGDDRDRVTLTAEPSLAGEARWRVELETTEPDLIPDNNVKAFVIDLVDRPLRVLFVDGYPRWEYRYLKNLLVREKSIDCSVMLISADRDFAQEGNQPITRLPRSPEELARYDVVVLGDVPASFFSPDQLDMLRGHVAERGAGLLWIGGPYSTPESYTGTVLADLLPMRGSLTLAPVGRPVTIEPTELADALGVLRVVTADGIGWPRELREASTGWSQLQWAQRIEPGRLKPTAEVLAQTVQPVDGAPLPVVVNLRYGAGQSIYVATDEIWRWRYGRGELLPDQFWIQMIRMLGRESLTAAESGAALEVDPRRVEIGQPVHITLRLLDAQLLDARRSSVSAVLERDDGTPLATIELRRSADSESRFAATYRPDAPGSLRVRMSDPSLAALELVAPVEVFAPDDELRRPETDHALLAQLAASTGGEALTPEQIRDLPELLPNRAVRTLNPLRERIWDTPLAFLLLLGLLTAEWIGRKVLRLV